MKDVIHTTIDNFTPSLFAKLFQTLFFILEKRAGMKDANNIKTLQKGAGGKNVIHNMIDDFEPSFFAIAKKEPVQKMHSTQTYQWHISDQIFLQSYFRMLLKAQKV